ncbi:MAG: MFS transporter [Acetobacteraceae bacterium]
MVPRDGTLPARGPRALDLLNFFIADVQTGFGPFVAVYLTTQKWTQVEIGFALSLGTAVALISQLPAGALVDAVHNKRTAVSGALLAVATAALLLAFLPTPLPVMVAQMLHAVASCVLTPAIAAISLQLAGHAALGERLGRNARYASVGNGLAAAVMGATGAWLSSQAVFLLTAVLCVPALLSLLALGNDQPAPPPGNRPRFDFAGLGAAVHRPAPADLRRLRGAVPPVERGHAAAGGVRHHDARRRRRQPDHRRLHRGTADRRGDMLAHRRA